MAAAAAAAAAAMPKIPVSVFDGYDFTFTVEMRGSSFAALVVYNATTGDLVRVWFPEEMRHE